LLFIEIRVLPGPLEKKSGKEDFAVQLQADAEWQIKKVYAFYPAKKCSPKIFPVVRTTKNKFKGGNTTNEISLHIR